MAQAPVLIVGAGPSGLMMAFLLTKFNIPVRLIDRKSAPTFTTNAAGIQTRTIEILEHIGIAKEFLEKSLVTTRLALHSEKQTLANVPLDIVDSFYKYIVMLPQSETEAILNREIEKLGIHVERNIELLEFKQVGNKVLSTLKFSDGKTEMFESDWVIGCDGYNSTVRNNAHISMVGKDFDQEFFVADMRISSPLDRTAVNMFINKGTLVGVFPLPDEKNELYRAVGNIGRHKNKDKFTDSEIRDIITDYTQGECEVKEVTWSSPFWIHSKVASKLQNQRVFIAGDAAHVHSPAGAQGMNTGLQDAFNLAWKLALVIKGQAEPKILDSYQEERLPIIKNVLRFTELLGFFGLSTSSLLFHFRNFIFKNVANKVKFMQKKMVGMITQVALRYKNSSLIDQDTKGHSSGPQPGERLPDVMLPNNTRLYDYLRDLQHHYLLLFTGDSPTADTVSQITAAYEKVNNTMSGLIKPYIVSNQKINVPNFIEDTDQTIHRRYAVSSPSMCLIRPDQYIAFFVGNNDVSALQAFLQKTGFKLS